MNQHALDSAPVRSLRSFHVVTKPIGSRCNLDCTYCYYVHKETRLPDNAASRISDDLLEKFIRQYIAQQDIDSVTFNWHGGEPTLAGLDFYSKIVKLEQKYADGKRIENQLQTNGLLLDESWCEFLKQYDFLVGLSIDGPKHLHDRFRTAKDGTPSFDRVYRAAKLLRQYEVRFNPLTVVNAINARQPEEVYQFLTEDLGCRRLQWSPCVEPKCYRTTAPGYWDPGWMPLRGSATARPGNPMSVVTDWSVDPDEWGEFLCRTFDLWLKKDLGKVFVNWFESLVGQWMGQRAQICTLAGVCGRSLITLEKDGSVYSCDQFVYPEYKLGKLGDGRQLVDIVYSAQQRKFGCNKHEGLPTYCKRCQYNFACNGECPKNRFIKTPDGQPGLNYLCSGINRFLAYADPHLRKIAAKVERTRMK